MKPILLVAFLVASAAQAGSPSAPTQIERAKAEQDLRIQSIWYEVNERIVRQQDVWFEDGEFPTTVQLIKFQAEIYPDNYDIWTNLGWMQENIEEWDDALATYIRYRRENPTDPDGALPLGEYLGRVKLWSKIPEVLEPAIKGRCHPNCYRLLARSYEKQGMFTDSIRVLKQFIARDPNDGAAKLNLSRVEKKLAEQK